MASGDEWDAVKMLDLYIHDYLVKKKMHKTAEIFAKESDVSQSPVVIESPGGFLNEWWSILWDLYFSRMQVNPIAKEGSSTQAMQMSQQGTCQLPTGVDFDQILGAMGQPAAGLLAAKMYEEERLRLLSRDFDPNIRLLDVDQSGLSYHNQSSSNASHTHQQITRKPPQQVPRDYRRGYSLGSNLPMDSAFYGVPTAMVPRTILDSGMNKRTDLMPLKGWPLTGVDQIPQLGYQVLNSLLPIPNQLQKFQMPAGQHQEDYLACIMAQTPVKPTSSFPGSSSNFMLPKSEVGGKDGHMSQMMTQAQDQRLIIPIGQTPESQQKDQLKEQKLCEDQYSRKRKNLSCSQSKDNALIAHTTSGVHDEKIAEADKSLDENVDSFLSHDDENADIDGNPFSTLQQRSTACDDNEQKGFSFQEVYCLNSSKSKVLSCHFSSDGKLLASAGHDKKVPIWNMDTLNFFYSAELHSHIITDVRFRPNSTLFATSSFDRTVQIWNAAKPNKSLLKLVGHTEQVMSLDFHPRKTDLLCSCDSNAVIRVWNIHQCVGTEIFQGASRQVRFQPRVGNLLAAASGNGISLFEVGTNILQYHLEGHVKEVRAVCWDISGKYIASVSEDSARVWSIVSGGKCVHELHSNGNKFESCTFHPGYSQLLVIGSYQTLELWNPTDSNKTLTVAAHSGIISTLAESPHTELIASGSHDHLVKLWK